MAVIALFDKSFLQSLSVDESVFFDQFFLSVICPMFYVETLADLEKAVRQGRTPEQEVGIIAAKTPELNSTVCPNHLDLCAHNLMGNDIPMDGIVPRAGGKRVKVEGKSGVVYEPSSEEEAFLRWQGGDFLEVEREDLRANIDETLTAAIITEQGGKEKHRERSQDFSAFCSQFAGRRSAGQGATAHLYR